MQVFGNVASPPERKVSKNTQKGYYEFRLAESQKGVDTAPTWYTVRMMLDENPQLNKGDFARVTGKLKTDFYIGRDGMPSGTLLIIAFEASKVSKLAAVPDGEKSVTPVVPKEVVKEKAPAVQQVRPQTSAPVEQPMPAPERQAAAVAQEESDWSSLYS
jgi:single-stranded DNA-binding protein